MLLSTSLNICFGGGFFCSINENSNFWDKLVLVFFKWIYISDLPALAYVFGANKINTKKDK